jgi:hypothetical protein
MAWSSTPFSVGTDKIQRTNFEIKPHGVFPRMHILLDVLPVRAYPEVVDKLLNLSISVGRFEVAARISGSACLRIWK